MLKPRKPLPDDRKAVLLANDAEALAASVLAPRGTDGIEHILPKLDLPCLLYCGDADGFYAGSRESASVIPNAVFATIRDWTTARPPGQVTRCCPT